MHRKLNRSCVVGVTLIGPQLLTQILTVLFYCHNVKLDGERHKCNSEIVPVLHPPLKPSGTRNIGYVAPLATEVLSRVELSQNIQVSDDRGSGVIERLIDYIDDYRNLISRIQAKSCGHTISIYGLVYQEKEVGEFTHLE